MRLFSSISKVGKKVAGGVGKLGRKVSDVSGNLASGLEGVRKVQKALRSADDFSGGLISSTLKKVPIAGDLAAKSFSKDTIDRVGAVQDKLKKVSKAGKLADDVASGRKGVVQGVKEGVKLQKEYKKGVQPGKKQPPPPPPRSSSLPKKPEFVEDEEVVEEEEVKPPPPPPRRKRPELIESTQVIPEAPQYIPPAIEDEDMPPPPPPRRNRGPPPPPPRQSQGPMRPSADMLDQIRGGVQLRRRPAEQERPRAVSDQERFLQESIRSRRMAMQEDEVAEEPEDDSGDWD